MKNLALVVAVGMVLSGACTAVPTEDSMELFFEKQNFALDGFETWPPDDVVELKLTIAVPDHPVHSKSFYDLDSRQFRMPQIPVGDEAIVTAELIALDDWVVWHARQTDVSINPGGSTRIVLDFHQSPTGGIPSNEPDGSTTPALTLISTADAEEGYTRTPDVLLETTAQRAEKVYVSLTGSVFSPDDQAFSYGSPIPIELSTVEGVHEVTAWFVDTFGYPSRAATARITLDRNGPEETSVYLESSTLITDEDGAVWKASPDQTVGVYALASGAVEMLIVSAQYEGDDITGVISAFTMDNNSKTDFETGIWRPYLPHFQVVIGHTHTLHPVSLLFRDQAHNVTPIIANQIFLTAPSITPQITPPGSLPAGCFAPPNASGWVGIETKLAVSGTADKSAKLTEARFFSLPPGTDEMKKSEEITQELTLANGTLSGTLQVPGYIADDSSLVLWGQVRISDTTGPRFSPTDAGFSNTLQVDRTPPAEPQCTVLTPTVIKPVATVAYTTPGACAVKVFEDIGVIPDWMPASQDEAHLQVALLTSTEAVERTIMITARDAAGNTTSQTCGTVTYKQTLPVVDALSISQVNQSQFSSDHIRPGDLVSAYGLTDGHEITSAVIEWESGETFPVAGLTVTDGELSGQFAMPENPAAPSEENPIRLAVKLKDEWGLEMDTAHYSINTLLYDDIPPKLISALIDQADDSGCTSSLEGAISVSAAGAAFARLSGEVDNSSNWQPVNATTQLPFTLAAFQGQHTLDLDIADAAGNTITQTLTVWLDTEAPPVLPVSPVIVDEGMVVGPDGIPWTRLNSLSLKLTPGEDTHCGPMETSITPLDDPPGIVTSGWKTWSPETELTFTGEDGSRTFCVQYRDALGNQTGCAPETTVTIIRKLSPPVPVEIYFADESQGFLPDCQTTLMIHAEDSLQELDGHPLTVQLTGSLAADNQSNFDLLDDYWTALPVTITGNQCATAQTIIASIQVSDPLGNTSTPVSTSAQLAMGPPETPQLSLLHETPFADDTVVALRAVSKDPDFAAVERHVCAWCLSPTTPGCTCEAQQPPVADDVFTFHLPLPDTTYSLCIRALDIFAEKGDFQCITIDRDNTPPVTEMLRTTDLDNNGEVELAPCSGGRSNRNQTFKLQAHDQHPDNLVTSFTGGADNTGGTEFTYGGSEFLVDSIKTLFLGSKDSVDNSESTRTVRQTFKFDHHTVPLGLGAFWGATATLLNNGNILVLGGSGGMSPTRNTWAVLSRRNLSIVLPEDGTPGHSSIAESELHTAISLPDGRVALIGGTTRESPLSIPQFHNTIRLFAATGEPAETTPAPFTPRVYQAAIRKDNVIAIYGGMGPLGNVLSDLIILDIETWTATIVDTGVPRLGPSPALLADGRVAFLAGADLTQQGTATILVVDTDNPDSWETSELAIEPRVLATAIALPDDRILLAGGLAKFQGLANFFMSDVRESAALLDGSGTLESQVFDAIDGGLEFAGIVLPDETVLLAGGFGDTGVRNNGRVLHSSNLLPVAELESLGGGRAGAAVIPLENGGVALLGGTLHPIQIVYDNALVLQGSAGWQVIEHNSVTARLHAASSPLPEGGSVVLGGLGAGGSSSSAYSITPAGSIADFETDPAFARVSPAVVPLPSGNMLLIGGQKLLKSDTPETTWEAVASAALVTPELEVLQHITHPQFARVDSTAILLDRNHVGIFAGATHKPEPVLQNVIVLELDDNSLLAVDNNGAPIIQTLPWPDGPARRGATISRLDNGQIAVLGGCTSWERTSCLDSGLLFSVSQSGTPEFAASIPTIGGARGEHQAVMLHDGNVLLTGGGVDAATPTAIVLDGQTLPALPVKLNLEAGTTGCRDQQIWLLPTGNVMQWGGRCPDAAGELTLREDVWFLDPKTGDTEYMSLWQQPGWGHTVAPAGGGGVLVLGGTSSIKMDFAQAAVDATDAIRLAGHTEHSISLPALWYGASFADTTGAFLPAGSTGVDAHSPGPSCQASMGSMPGWDRTYRIRMDADDTYRIRVTPLDDQHDPAIYIMKSPHRRDGEFCYAGQNLLGAGKPETLQFSASPPTGRGTGDYFVVIDMQTPGTSMDFHIEVVRDFSELSKSIPDGGTP